MPKTVFQTYHIPPHGKVSIAMREDRQQYDRDVANEVIQTDVYGIRNYLYPLHFIPKYILDIGGHIGTFGMLVAKVWPDSVIVACEPNPESAALYKMSALANMLSEERVKVLECGVGYDPKKNVLTDGLGATGGGATVTPAYALELVKDGPRVGGAPMYSVLQRGVKICTIEEILPPSFGKVNLLKMDCEGAEIDIIENCPFSAEEWIHGWVVGEFHGVTMQEFQTLVEDRWKAKRFFGIDNNRIGSFRFYVGTE